MPLLGKKKKKGSATTAEEETLSGGKKKKKVEKDSTSSSSGSSSSKKGKKSVKKGSKGKEKKGSGSGSVKSPKGGAAAAAAKKKSGSKKEKDKKSTTTATKSDGKKKKKKKKKKSGDDDSGGGFEKTELPTEVYDEIGASTRARAISKHNEFMEKMDMKLEALRRRQTLRSLDDMKEAPKEDSRYFVKTADLETVRVIGRFRPINEAEKKMDIIGDRPEYISDTMAEVQYASQTSVQVSRYFSFLVFFFTRIIIFLSLYFFCLFRCTESSKDPYKCALDFILPPKLKQHHVLNLIGRPFVENVLRGFNGTIFAYVFLLVCLFV